MIYMYMSYIYDSNSCFVTAPSLLEKRHHQRKKYTKREGEGRRGEKEGEQDGGLNGKEMIAKI